MARPRAVVTVGVVLAALTLLSRAAAAQNTGIAGVVRDSSGAVLPGVTVEASSPVLIEKVRSVVTDGQGLYSIVDLRPGAYVVTFTLPGFTTVRREGIELTGSFTATVNAELRVGAVEETITVSGQSPDVDVRNVVQQSVLTDEVREALPTGRSPFNMSEIIPGVSVVTSSRPSGHDVGGLTDLRGASVIHGSRREDYVLQLDGTPITLAGSGYTQVYQIDPGEVQEFTYELGALSAEAAGGGIRANMIPKEGGNRFSGYFFATYADHNLQSNNLDEDLVARGVPTPNKLQSAADVNASGGGPIVGDRLWFFASFRRWGADEEVPGMYHMIDPTSVVFDPRLGAAGNADLNRPAVFNFTNENYSGRLTWQASPKNKLSFYGAHQPRRNDLFLSGVRSVEASVVQHYPQEWLLQATWKAPITSRVLLEAGWARNYAAARFDEQLPGLAGSDLVSIADLGTGYQYRASTSGYNELSWNMPSARAAMSYVTGSHAAKFGIDYQWGFSRNRDAIHNDYMSYQFRNGVPFQITVFNEPIGERRENFGKLALFAQDQWTVKRLTINGGVRLDLHTGSVPTDQTTGPNPHAPFQSWPGVENTPDWKDLSPRMGIAYDLFGNGKTALKGTFSRYVVVAGTELTSSRNPLGFNFSATRQWTDRNGDFAPQESELGPLSNRNFATAATTRTIDDAVLQGWYVRPDSWEASAALQHELFPRVSVNAGYTRRWFGKLTAIDNLAVTPANYEEFCLTAPADPQLGSASGSRVCGLYDLNPSKLGQVQDLITSAETYGTQREYWQGIDVSTNARLPHRISVAGGLTSGTDGNSTDACFAVDSPGGVVDDRARSGLSPNGFLAMGGLGIGGLRFCRVDRPWRTSFRFLGTIDLPWDIQVGATLQSNPGPEILAHYTVTNAQVGSVVQFVDPARTVFSAGSSTVSLVEPGTMFGDRMNQLDLRLAKGIRFRHVRTLLMLDLTNMLNGNAVLVENNAYGSRWRQPIAVLQGRTIKPGVRVEF